MLPWTLHSAEGSYRSPFLRHQTICSVSGIQIENTWTTCLNSEFIAFSRRPTQVAICLFGPCNVYLCPLQDIWYIIYHICLLDLKCQFRAMKCFIFLLLWNHSGDPLNRWIFLETLKWKLAKRVEIFWSYEFRRGFMLMKCLQWEIDSGEGFSWDQRREGGLAGELLNLWNIWPTYPALLARLPSVYLGSTHWY